jgi:hypothetical protein
MALSDNPPLALTNLDASPSDRPVSTEIVAKFSRIQREIVKVILAVPFSAFVGP